MEIVFHGFEFFILLEGAHMHPPQVFRELVRVGSAEPPSLQVLMPEKFLRNKIQHSSRTRFPMFINEK